MGMFDEQIRERKLGDQELFEDSILRMASAVVGKEVAGSMASGRIVTKEAVDDILKFYRINPRDIPSHITDPDEQLEYALRPHGIMHRMVELTDVSSSLTLSTSNSKTSSSLLTFRWAFVPSSPRR